MTDTAITANRRSFLGGGAMVAVGAAAIPFTTLAAAPSRTAWGAALANVARCNAAMKAAQEPHNRAERAYMLLRPKYPTPDEIFAGCDTVYDAKPRLALLKEAYARADELARQQTGFAEAEISWAEACSAAMTAAEELILCPAPDIAAVAHKIEVAQKERMDLADLDPVLADLRRLAGEVS